MTDFSCMMSGLLTLLTPPLLLVWWQKKTGARLFPALLAYAVCLPVFIVGAGIRSAMHQENLIAFSIGRGLLYGILEEGIKFVMFRYVLTAYDSRKDAVTYAIGHGSYEGFASGIACFGLIGMENVASNIFWLRVMSGIEDIAFVVSVTVLIFYGVRTGKSRVTLPAAVLLHAAGNAAATIFIDPASLFIRLLLTAGACYAAYRCWQALWDPYADES